ncbi:hypothetical protein DFQ27_009217 [Actinomortierella ambigua]|uniref:N-acetyltransferase domain-containing protein n=1 Tax=Actinomortierella ambigua TaxID=1343610 RepID=A0A9P6PQJ8_9FUNG|nr:hypothetical protein DFQ26_001788 [Actinomortierella ambigua]KAG0250757.1 hypothetical protein DFQ27_009217 [Actinomortierella ambigua]
MAIIDIQPATPKDVPLILDFIKSLAEYERLSHQVVATEEILHQSLFGAERRYAEVIIAYYQDDDKYKEKVPAGFALFFHNFSTFLGRPGLYLEDLFVKPEFRGTGIGKRLLIQLATLAKERQCGRYEWVVLDWNEPSRKFYEALGAEPHAEWIIHRVEGKSLDALAAM